MLMGNLMGKKLTRKHGIDLESIIKTGVIKNVSSKFLKALKYF